MITKAQLVQVAKNNRFLPFNPDEGDDHSAHVATAIRARSKEPLNPAVSWYYRESVVVDSVTTRVDVIGLDDTSVRHFYFDIKDDSTMIWYPTMAYEQLFVMPQGFIGVVTKSFFNQLDFPR